jgi:hypothetical protein
MTMLQAITKQLDPTNLLSESIEMSSFFKRTCLKRHKKRRINRKLKVETSVTKTSTPNVHFKVKQKRANKHPKT